jgi:hypothetical protein
MNIKKIINDNIKQQKIIGKQFQKTKEEKYYNEHEALEQYNQILEIYFDYIDELTQMAYNVEYFQKYFYEKFQECKEDDYILKLTKNRYNAVVFNDILLNTRKLIIEKLENCIISQD